MSKGLTIPRLFTQKGKDPLKTVKIERRSCKITKPDGSVVFEMNDFGIPKSWSQNAGDIMISKYARKAGVPQKDENGNLIKDEKGETVLGPEKCATLCNKLHPIKHNSRKGARSVLDF